VFVSDSNSVRGRRFLDENSQPQSPNLLSVPKGSKKTALYGLVISIQSVLMDFDTNLINASADRRQAPMVPIRDNDAPIFAANTADRLRLVVSVRPHFRFEPLHQRSVHLFL
jgi:hypothetical protein